MPGDGPSLAPHDSLPRRTAVAAAAAASEGVPLSRSDPPAQPGRTAAAETARRRAATGVTAHHGSSYKSGGRQC